jgi:hypothetical protein
MPQFVDTHYIAYLARCRAYQWHPLRWLTWFESCYYKGYAKPIIPMK